MEEQETTNVTTRSVGIRYGLILALISIVFFVIMNVAGLDMQGPVSYLSYVFMIVIFYLAHKYYKENGDSYMSIGQGVGIAFWAGLISSLISSAFMYVYIKFIDSAFVENIKTKQIEKMQEQGMSDEQIDQAMQFAGAFMSPEAMAGFGIFGGIIGALILGVIVSLFTKNSSPDDI